MILAQLAELAKKLFEPPPPEPEDVQMGRALIAELEKPTGECDTKGCLSLIERGARLDVENGDDMTAFMLAAWHGYTDVFKAIAVRGVNPDQTDVLQNTALMIAAEKGHEAIVDFLVDELVNADGMRPDAEKKNHCGDTAYSFALRNGHESIAQKLEKRMGSQALEKAKKRAQAPDMPPII